MTVLVLGVVGPSGVGKDTVMHALCGRLPSARLVRRVITRPAEAGGEDFEGLTPEVFRQRDAAGDFVLSWQAHGLSYGIPKAEIADRSEDAIALVNLSRSVLEEAAGEFPHFRVLSLSASIETLAHRLAGRGRESETEIAKRLQRAGYARPVGANVIEISNDGDLNDTITAILAALQPVRA